MDGCALHTSLPHQSPLGFLHRQVGWLAAAMALGVTVSTLYVFVDVWRGWENMGAIPRANRLLLPSFAVLVLLGVLLRHKMDWHRRAMLMATFYMLEPVISRSLDPLEQLLGPASTATLDEIWMSVAIVTWNALFVSLFIYDVTTTRRIHPVTWGGTLWFFVVWSVI